MNQDREASIQFKIHKAESLLKEAEKQIDNGFYNTAVNRIYYACFHATNALLLSQNLISKTHSGTIHQLHSHFVSKGIFDKKHSSFYNNLMQQRMDSDYSDFLVIIKDEADILIQPAKEYVAYITSLTLSP